ncbi:hypothetical protein JCM10213_007654 [Rhodosporidiobolus nylandii]
MLDRLPVELVQHVVRLAVPPPAILDNGLRYERLRTFSLTCKALAHAAQALLVAAVEISRGDAFDSFLAAVEGRRLGERVQTLRLEGQWDAGKRVTETLVTRSRCEALKKRCANLVELRIHCQTLDITWLDRLPHLLRLIIHNSTLGAVHRFSFPRLDELSLTNVRLDKHVLRPVAFPALRTLHLQLATFSPFSFHDLAPFFPQLDAFSCAALDISIPSHTLKQPLPRNLLFDLELSDLQVDSRVDRPDPHLRPLLPHIVNLRFSCESFAKRSGCEAWSKGRTAGPGYQSQLKTLTEELQRGFLRNLAVLYFPFCKLDVQPLLAVCKARGIEVVFERPLHPYLESLVSSEFWRRCKVEKAQKEDEDRYE